MHTYIPLRKLCPTSRHCKTNRGPPDLRMSLRHVLNFVRNSYIHIYAYMYLQLPLNCWTSFGYIRPSTLVSVLRIWTVCVFLVVKISVQDAKQKPFSPVVPLPPQPPPAEVAAPRLLGSPRRLRPVPQRPRQRHSLREAPKLGGWMSASLNFSAVELFFLFII